MSFTMPKTSHRFSTTCKIEASQRYATHSVMKRRINISLSDEAVRLLNRMAPKGDRSRFLEDLVKRTARDRAQLRARLKEGAIKRAQHDREVAVEWNPLSDELWRCHLRR